MQLPLENRLSPVRLWLVVGLIALASCGASAWQLLMSWQGRLEATRELVLSLSNATAHRMAVTLHGMDVLLQDTAEKSPDPMRLEPAHMEQFRSKLSLFPELEAIGFVDNGGMLRRVVHSSARFPALPIDVSDRDNFQFHQNHARENRLHINPPVQDRLTGQQVILLSRPLLGEKGQFSGMVSMAVHPRFIDRALAAAIIQNEASAAVFSEDGTVYSHFPYDSRVVGINIQDTLFFQSFRNVGWEGSSDRTISFADGQERIVGFRRVPNFPLVVAVGVSRAALVRGWLGELAVHALIQAGFIGLVAFLFWRLTRAERKRQALTQHLLEQERQHVQSLEQAVRTRTHELNQSLDALRDNEERFRRLLDTSPVGLVLSRFSDGRVSFINPAAGRLFQMQPQNAVHVVATDYWQNPTERTAMIERLESGENVLDLEVGLRRHDQQPFTALISASRLDIMGEPMALVAVQDISHRKILEEELERSNTDLEQFSYAVSHDLQEPLRMVSSYLTLIRRRYQDRLDAEGLDFMAFAVDGAQRMSRMISDLLDYSRVNRKNNPFGPVAMDRALAEALSNLAAVITDSQAIIEQPPALPTVYGDHSQLMRLWQNLIGNALKYRQPDQAPHIRLSVSEDDNGWIFQISDNGIGIEPSQAGRLFQVFQRLHPHGRYEGTGIGLAICRRITERHQGQIHMLSEGEGKGCTFRFTLPKDMPTSG